MTASATRRAALHGALAAALALSPPAVRAAPPLVVGLTLPETGLHAQAAEDARRGLVLWAEEASAAGGRRVELRILDDGSDARAAGALYGRLARDHGAEALLGPYGLAATLAAAASAEREGRPLLATAFPSARRARGERHVFWLQPPPQAWAEAILAAVSAAGAERLYLLARDDPASAAIAQALRDAARGAGLAIAEAEPLRPGSGDFSASIARARAFAAQAWIALAGLHEAARMVEGFFRAGWAPALFFAQESDQAAFRAQVGRDAEGALAAVLWHERARTPGNAGFVERYARRWGAKPSAQAALAYSAGLAIGAAAARAQAPGAAALREALAAIEVETPLGTLRAGADGRWVVPGPLLVQVQGGRVEVLRPETAASAAAVLPYAPASLGKATP